MSLYKHKAWPKVLWVEMKRNVALSGEVKGGVIQIKKHNGIVNIATKWREHICCLHVNSLGKQSAALS